MIKWLKLPDGKGYCTEDERWLIERNDGLRQTSEDCWRLGPAKIEGDKIALASEDFRFKTLKEAKAWAEYERSKRTPRPISLEERP